MDENAGSDLRDYQRWHRQYDDPTSALSWRLARVQAYLTSALDASLADPAGPAVSVLSLCSGDGRDVCGVLAHRTDAGRVDATLIELHPGIAEEARVAAAAAGLSQVEVRTADAGTTASVDGVAPAHIVLLVGIFGNISECDVERTVSAAPQLVRPGGYVVWSRGRPDTDDPNRTIRDWFAVAGFTELDYATLEAGSRPALGLLRYDGPPVALEPARRLFTFTR